MQSKLFKLLYPAILLLVWSISIMVKGNTAVGDSLPVPHWEEGYATITGKTINYDRAKDDNPNVQVYPRSSLGSYMDKKHGTVPVDSAGNYALSVKLYQTHQPCYIDVPGYYGLMYLTPGDSVTLTVDYAGRGSNGHQGNDGTVLFAGTPDSDLNNMLATNVGHDIIWNSFGNNRGFNKKYSDNTEFVGAVMAHRAAQFEHVDTLPFTGRMQQLLRLNIDCDAAEALLKAPIYQLVKPDSAYYSFIPALGIESPMMRWAGDYDVTLSYCSNLHLSDDDGPAVASMDAYILEGLLETGKLDDAETELVESMLRYNIDRLPAEVLNDRRARLSGRVAWLCDSLQFSGADKEAAVKLKALLADDSIRDARRISNCYLRFIMDIGNDYGVSLPSYYAEMYNDDFGKQASAFFASNNDALNILFNKYDADVRSITARHDMERNISRFTELTGIGNDEIRQNLIISSYSELLGNGALVPDEVFDEEIKDFHPVAVSFLTEQNDVLRRVLAKAVSNVGQMSPDDDADKLILSLVEKHNGKIIFIDIWNTWCGACLQAITEHEKDKGDYLDKVAFVYLADESSPETLWNERIKGITGDHYRLPLGQHQSIMQRFNFTGYPSYIIIDKNGDIVHTGFIHSLSEIDKWLR